MSFSSYEVIEIWLLCDDVAWYFGFHKQELVSRYACGSGHKQGVDLLKKLQQLSKKVDQKVWINMQQNCSAKKEGSQKLGNWVIKNPNRNYQVPDDFRFEYGSPSIRPEILGTQTEMSFGSGTRTMNTPS